MNIDWNILNSGKTDLPIYGQVSRTSASPTLMFKVQLYDEKGTDNFTHFKKIFVKYESFKRLPPYVEFSSKIAFKKNDDELDILGLEYENLIYSQIFNDIVQPRKCIYFLPPSPQEETKDLTFNEIVTKLSRGGSALDRTILVSRSAKSRGIKRSSTEFEATLLRHLVDIYYTQNLHLGGEIIPLVDGKNKFITKPSFKKYSGAGPNAAILDNIFEIAARASSEIAFTEEEYKTVIEDHLEFFEFLLYFKNNVTFGQISTLFVGADSLTTAVNNNLTIRKHPTPPTHEMMTIIFQLYMGCFVAGVNLIEHNDMHPGNVLVENLGTSRNAICNISSSTTPYDSLVDVSFKTKHRVLLFDWDFSHSEKAGINKKLADYCGIIHTCNGIVEKFPPGQRVRVSALRNIVTITAWLCDCINSEKSPVYKTGFINFLINSISLPGKEEDVKELFGITCISNTFDKRKPSKYYRKKKNATDNPLGDTNIRTGSFFLDPVIYSPGELFLDPITILNNVGEHINDRTLEDGFPETEINIEYTNSLEYYR